MNLLLHIFRNEKAIDKKLNSLKIEYQSFGLNSETVSKLQKQVDNAVVNRDRINAKLDLIDAISDELDRFLEIEVY